MDMVSYLSGLGHEPARIKGNDFWYRSPLREERTASFKVNRMRNRWFDFGTGKGGSLIDFAIEYHGCTVGEFLASLRGALSFQRPPSSPATPRLPSGNAAGEGIEVLDVKPLFHPVLLDYLHERRIPQEIADAYCREVHFRNRGNSYFAIGFPNDDGGFELRNAYFKGSSSPKGVSTVKGGSDELAVFEGFFDFLSYLVILPRRDTAPADFMILNSLAFFENAFPAMEGYRKVRLFLDNDRAGQNCSLMARSRDIRFVDESGLYRNHGDLNDFLVNVGRLPDRASRLKPGSL